MKEFKEFEKEEKNILEALKKKGSTQPCAGCCKSDFAILKGYFITEVREIQSGEGEGKYAPSVGVVCTNCGFIRQHSVGLLLDE